MVHNPDVRCSAAIQMKRESSRKSRGGRAKLAEAAKEIRQQQQKHTRRIAEKEALYVP